MIIPKIHMNGSSQAELVRQISETNRALEKALDTLRNMAPNARDYYITGNFKEAEAEHIARMEAVKAVQDEIMQIGEGIADQELPRRNPQADQVTPLNPYQSEGYQDRDDYLKGMSEEYGVPLATVRGLAEMLGENEDFDGLVTHLQDMEDQS